MDLGGCGGWKELEERKLQSENIIFFKFCFQKKKKVYKVESHPPLASYMLVHMHVHTPTYTHVYKHVHTHTIHIDTQNSKQINSLLFVFE